MLRGGVVSKIPRVGLALLGAETTSAVTQTPRAATPNRLDSQAVEGLAAGGAKTDVVSIRGAGATAG